MCRKSTNISWSTGNRTGNYVGWPSQVIRRRSKVMVSRRSSGTVETSSIDSSSLTTLLLLKELTDVIRSHDLSENRVRVMWHQVSGQRSEVMSRVKPTFPSDANLCRKSLSSVFMSLYPETNKVIRKQTWLTVVLQYHIQYCCTAVYYVQYCSMATSYIQFLYSAL